MKKILFFIVCMVVVLHGKAQNYDVYNKFMQQYMNMKMGYMVEDLQSEDGYRVEVQVGKPVPDYYFDRKLNSKSLKGKYVVFDFWATWCGGCRVLSHYMDSLMIKNTDLYTKNNVQLIGVNYKEKLVNKGYDARKYWKEKGFSFPTVDSKGVEAFGDTVHAEHPTAIIVDDKGIIRYRVDGAGPKTASEIMFALWALKFLPESGLPMTLETAQKFAAEGKYMEGLYILYNLPSDKDIDFLKFTYALEVNKYNAEQIFKECVEKYENQDDYQTLMCQFAEKILEENVSELYEPAWRVLTDFYNHGHFGTEKREKVISLSALLQNRYGKSLQQKGLSMLKSILKTAKSDNKDPQLIKSLEEMVEKCK